MWLATLTSALLLASTVSAGLISDVGHVARRDAEMEKVARKLVDSLTMDKRQTTTSTGTGAFNVTDWDVQTNAACVATLNTLNGVASNPAGLALCYNVVSMDDTNGTFYADMRIYMVANPTGDFANVPAQNVMVAAQFSGATVQTVGEAALQKREETYGLESWPSIRRSVEGRVIKRAMTPTLVQSYGLFGKINMTGVTDTTDAKAKEALLTPTVTLSATTSGTASVNTTLSVKEASFIQGVFADTAAKALAITNLANTPNMTGIAAVVIPPGTLFRTPGTQILIFPIGAIITGIWTVALLSTIAYGTVGRMGFREQFRSRTARATRGAAPRI